MKVTTFIVRSLQLIVQRSASCFDFTIVTTSVKCIIIKMLLVLIFIACVAELLKQKSKINLVTFMVILLYT